METLEAVLEVQPDIQPEDVEARLEELADKANEEHHAAEDSAKEMAFHAMQAGEVLLNAKRLIPHGQWTAWLRRNIKARPRTVQLYIQMARKLDTQRVAGLSIRKAVSAMHAADKGSDDLGPKAKRRHAVEHGIRDADAIARLGVLDARLHGGTIVYQRSPSR